ncbi:MAG: tRNA glutamyl-Q(34) synthetase GluQRS [Pseudomonadota bacterium]
MTFITRFAPSPTGYLHLGHAFSALLAYDEAKRHNGKFLLRIEDIDQTRCRPEYEDALFKDLKWLGIEWAQPVLRQSERFSAYQQRLDVLYKSGLIYRCFRTRKEIEDITRAPHGALPFAKISPPPSKEEEEAALVAGKPFSWRLSAREAQKWLEDKADNLFFTEKNGMKKEKVFAAIEDFDGIILARKDIGTSYHLASVHDDIAQGITHVIRGEDLRQSAGLHTLLYALFDAPRPLYHHHPLITDENGERLSKRQRSLTLRSLRQSGVSPNDIRKRLHL